MLYKAGDCVVIREDLVVGQKYGSIYFVEPMKEFLGKTVVIKMVNPITNTYSIVENQSFGFSDEMFVPKASTEIVNVIGEASLELLIQGWALQHSNGRTVYYMDGGKLYSYVDRRQDLHSESQEEFNKIMQTSFKPLYNYKDFKAALEKVKDMMKYHKITLEDIKNA